VSYSTPVASPATRTRLRTPQDVSPFSGMCSVCVEGCTGTCEIGCSAVRGSEFISPITNDKTQTASEKDYPVDYSHLNIMGSAFGAYGIEEDSDKAIFTSVNLNTAIGKNNDIKLKLPLIIPGLGSTDIARKNWKGLAIGAAISGVILTIGENVCGIDPESEFDSQGKVINSPELAERVRLYKDWQQKGYGEIVVQSNVEDSRFGVLEYAIRELGVETVELKWGQGAKNIGGEIKIDSLDRALKIKKRGYIVLPDPLDPDVQKAFKHGDFKEFERHSRIGMASREDFMDSVGHLRKAGAKHIFLKTGAYGPEDLARAMRYSSDAGIDLITIDGAGGGTGMSPWRMMNEWGIPTIYLQSIAFRYAKIMEEKGLYVPDMAIAGGFTLEDHIFKGLAMGAPYFKLVGMSRSPITACMVGKTISEKLNNGKLPKSIAKYGTDMESVFVEITDLKKELGQKAENVPGAAVGLYSYYKRLEQGLKQFMCGARKFDLKYMTRGDLVALTGEASVVTGIPYVMDYQAESARKVLDS